MSMLFSFMTGVLLTAVIFPRFNGCPDAAVIAEAAVKNCPACPSSSCPICPARRPCPERGAARPAVWAGPRPRRPIGRGGPRLGAAWGTLSRLEAFGLRSTRRPGLEPACSRLVRVSPLG